MQQEIYLIRHGETDYNSKGVVQGRGINSSLNQRGKQQAQAFFDAFHQIPFDAIFTSSLKRTHETVEPFKKLGYDHHVFSELDEIDWGIHEGQIAGSTMSEEYRALTSEWRKGNLHLKIDGGESPLELQQRQRNFIENHLLPFRFERLLICCHGRAMRSLLCTVLNKDLSLMDDYPHQNLSLYQLTINHEIFEVVNFNNIDHVAHL